MLHCVYHAIDSMRVVPTDERDALVASGFWFNSPKDALEFGSKVESSVEKEKSPKRRARVKKENENG